MNNQLDNQTKKLIEEYFDAFSNLYGIISMKRAFRIIKEQNPEIDLHEDAFIDFIENFDFDEKYYIIVYDEEMYSDGPVNGTDSMKKFLITDFLFTVDDEAYDEMKFTQDGLRFYVPEREELLKYSSDDYFEQNEPYFNLADYFINKMHLSVECTEEIIEEWVCIWRSETDGEDIDVDMCLDSLMSYSHGKFKKFKNIKQAKEFFRLYIDMYNNTRMPMYRGHTPKEVGLDEEGEVRYKE
ncbi:MAG: hypothetical protein ACI3X1_03000 [Eubacteriales bacterium]